MKKAKLEAPNPSKPLTASSLAKKLASCDKATRDKSLRLLIGYLTSRQHQISIEELKKIWKGLFYCVWHADKQSVQLELINKLASLLVSLDLPLSINFFQVFLLTIRREWSGIDYLRLDKFYLLNRRFLHHFFLLLKNNSWQTQLLSNLMGILRDKTLISADKYPSQGVNYHLAEIFLPELIGFLPVKSEIIDVLLEPFCCVLERSSDKVLVNKVKVNVFDCLLENGRKLLKVKEGGGEDSVKCTEDVEKFGAVALTAGLSKKFFDLASSSDSLQGNRKVLFDLHGAFLKIENLKVKMMVEISVPMDEESKNFKDNGIEKLLDDDCIKEVQDFIACSETVPESVDRSTEKLRKKSKKALSKKMSDRRSKKSRTKNLSESVSRVSVPIVNNDGDDAAGMANQGAIANGDDSLLNAVNSIAFDESVMSSLQQQFEKAAAEAGMDMDSPRLNGIPVSVISSGSRKRKRMKKANGKVSHGLEVSIGCVDESVAGKSDEKSAKKVSFSMKNNLIWKPHSPLPPQSLRLPPSATPRGSALKKGIPPGPVHLMMESPTPKKMKKKANNMLKKSRKNPKSFSPSIKRLRKLQANAV